MTDSQLQQLVEALGSKLRRSVAIDDAQLRLLAYSPHYGPVDEPRLSSILDRVAPEAVLRSVEPLITAATGPIKVAADPELKMLPRLAVPIRCRGFLLGFLVLIDADESLTEEEVGQCAATADLAASVLFRDRLIDQIDQAHQRELLRDLFSAEPVVRSQAAAKLVETELLVTGQVVALVIRLAGAGVPGDRGQVAADMALLETRRHLAARRAVHLARPDHGVLLVSRSAIPAGAGQLELGELLRRTAVREADVDRVFVGVGGPRELTEALASYEEARLAAKVADVVGTGGPVVRWADLGVYRTLTRLPLDRAAASAVLDPAVTRLFESDRNGTLVTTAEAFLDLACSPKRTTGELKIHRASLYGRLEKIESITGLRFNDGGDRLALHLGLKLARLAGLHPDEAP
ncbi:PucR family transcriptional regulator [Nonomuraea endophytica]|uniref:PucR C-terminal helix-turn-helix domain-containing protein n=1 Tax=Nonomuraea endophytica TaxID=714136 RepID=A0A7W8AB09_9ACTN|nr:helix-turn-helix domain-containing protein [Nonomuraea endophytica]MBB5081498.1 hypothetical protein [Nonomuraea endophytica]